MKRLDLIRYSSPPLLWATPSVRRTALASLENNVRFHAALRPAWKSYRSPQRRLPRRATELFSPQT